VRKRSKWWAKFDGDSLYLRTPWFVFVASYGGWDYQIDCKWWGVRVLYDMDWEAPPFMIPWKREWKWIKLQVTREQMVERGGCAL
jgi:hypothetical protein